MAADLGPRDADDEEEPVETVSLEDMEDAEQVASDLVEATEESNDD